MIIISITFDIPTAYCEYSLSLWNHEYEDSKALYQQQHALANARMKKEEFERKQKILLRFKQVLIRAAIHFKRLNIELDDFLSKNSKTIKPFEEESSYNLICAIKDKDPDAVIRMVKENNFVVFDFDHVKIFILLTSLI